MELKNENNLPEFEKNTFGWEEYSVFATILLISTAIGLYFGFFEKGFKLKKKATAEEYHLANRKLNPFPVSLSLLATFLSATSFISYPVEIYYYGVQNTLTGFTYIYICLTTAYILLPVYHKLQLTSVYEYPELRFNSKFLRYLSSFLSAIRLIAYMTFTVYSPSLAISQVTGFNERWAAAIIFFVCSFYSSLGGIKAVVWTDFFQTFVLLGSILIVCIIGVSDLGGLGDIWDKANKYGRTDFFDFDPDWRVRQTFWTATVGGYFFWLSSFNTQSMVQRYVAMKSISYARRSIFLQCLGLILAQIFILICGLMIFAKYYQCDPVQLKIANNSDQIFPLYVMDLFKDLKGLPGLFVAGLTAGSLSSVSSGVNSFACMFCEDFLKKFRPNISESKLMLCSKIACFFAGTMSFLLIFAVENMGNILPAVNGFIGLLAGVFGIFILGMVYPWANKIGSQIGFYISFALTAVIVISANVARNQGLIADQRMLFDKTPAQCTNNSYLYNSNSFSFNYNLELPILNNRDSYDNGWKEKTLNDSKFIKLISVSYHSYTTISIVTTILVGAILSPILQLISEKYFNQKRILVKSCYLSPPVLWLYSKLLSKEFLNKWIDFNEDENNNGKKIEDKS